MALKLTRIEPTSPEDWERFEQDQADFDWLAEHSVEIDEFDTEIRLVSPTESWIFAGKVNVFLDPHAADVPILGRDVLDKFAAIFDRAREDVILIGKPDGYEIRRARPKE